LLLFYYYLVFFFDLVNKGSAWQPPPLWLCT